jgi:hypothetical protein
MKNEKATPTVGRAGRAGLARAPRQAARYTCFGDLKFLVLHDHAMHYRQAESERHAHQRQQPRHGFSPIRKTKRTRPQAAALVRRSGCCYTRLWLQCGQAGRQWGCFARVLRSKSCTVATSLSPSQPSTSGLRQNITSKDGEAAEVATSFPDSAHSSSCIRLCLLHTSDDTAMTEKKQPGKQSVARQTGCFSHFGSVCLCFARSQRQHR